MIILPYFSRISSFFGRRNAPTKGASSFHKGMDIAAPAGTPVYAAADGVITVRESQRGYGNVVYVKHPDGTETRYGHLSGFTDLPVGAAVKAGSQIGFVGSTGVSTGNHLHFEVRDPSGQAVDPRLVFGSQLDTTKDMSGFAGNYASIQTMGGQGNEVNSHYKDYQHPLAATKKESDDIIAFEYKKRVAKRAEKTPSIFENIANNGLLGMLMDMFTIGKPTSTENEVETEADILNRPGVKFTLSKADMKNNGFSDQEISKIERFLKFKQKEGLNGALSENGQVITPEELAIIGLNEDKIDLFNRLADKKLNEQNNMC